MNTGRATYRLALAVIPVLACSLVVSGCKDDQEITQETAAATGESEPTPKPHSRQGEVTQPDSDQSPTPEVEPIGEEPKEPESSGEQTADQCVLGTWQVDNQEFEAMMNNILASSSEIPAGMNMTFAVTGGSFFRFDDKGQFFSWREDYTFTMGSGPQQVVFVSNSSETGTYGTVLDFRGLSNNSSTDFLWVDESMIIATDEVMTVAGMVQVVDRGEAGADFEVFGHYKGEVPKVEGRESMEGSLPFTCSNDTLTVITEVDTAISMHRTEAQM